MATWLSAGRLGRRKRTTCPSHGNFWKIIVANEALRVSQRPCTLNIGARTFLQPLPSIMTRNVHIYVIERRVMQKYIN